jgi:hypothetical protein
MALPHFSAGSLKMMNARQREERVEEIEAVKALGNGVQQPRGALSLALGAAR